ncbi:hypothetical protein ACHAW6_000768 [Cyclotella cf. meneghiniana]
MCRAFTRPLSKKNWTISLHSACSYHKKKVNGHLPLSSYQKRTDDEQDTNSLLNLILVWNTTPLSSMLRVETSAQLLHHLANTNMQGSRWDLNALLILCKPQWKTS